MSIKRTLNRNCRTCGKQQVKRRGRRLWYMPCRCEPVPGPQPAPVDYGLDDVLLDDGTLPKDLPDARPDNEIPQTVNDYAVLLSSSLLDYMPARVAPEDEHFDGWEREIRNILKGLFSERDTLKQNRDALHAAITKHHAQRADDLCWMDDDELYVAAGLPPRDNTVGDPDAMLANCKRFVAQRCQGGGNWKSYAEMEAEIDALEKQMADLELDRDVARKRATLAEQERDRLRRKINHALAELTDAVRVPADDPQERLDGLGQTDTALDIIFDQVDEMLLAGEFDRVNQLLVDTSLDEYSVELLLGVLTATLPAKDRLPDRCAFFQRVAQTLEARGEFQDGLLVGLD